MYHHADKGTSAGEAKGPASTARETVRSVRRAAAEQHDTHMPTSTDCCSCVPAGPDATLPFHHMSCYRYTLCCCRTVATAMQHSAVATAATHQAAAAPTHRAVAELATATVASAASAFVPARQDAAAFLIGTVKTLATAPLPPLPFSFHYATLPTTTCYPHALASPDASPAAALRSRLRCCSSGCAHKNPSYTTSATAASHRAA